jgi:(R)-2-hydroxyacyl-CoA dehydratese activating ATPase
MSEMQFAGLDVGSTTVKGARLDAEGNLLAQSILRTSGDYQADIRLVWQAIAAEGLPVVATGYGQDVVPGALAAVSEIGCHARGLKLMLPEARRVIDVGGQDLKVISVSEKGQPLNFLMNDKCAAGTGRFLDLMARALGTEIAQLSALAAQATQPVRINSMCTVFAESEVIGLLARNASPADIAAGLLASIAERISAMVKRLGGSGLVGITGGGALCGGLVQALAARLGTAVAVPEHPQLAGALGAALKARELVGSAMQQAG